MQQQMPKRCRISAKLEKIIKSIGGVGIQYYHAVMCRCCVCRYTTIIPQQGNLPGRSRKAFKAMQALPVQPQSPSPHSRFPTQAGQKLHAVTAANITIMQQKRYVPFSLANILHQIMSHFHRSVCRGTFTYMQQQTGVHNQNISTCIVAYLRRTDPQLFLSA